MILLSLSNLKTKSLNIINNKGLKNMEIKVICTFEQTFEVPEGIEIDTPEFDEFVIECIGSPEMLTHEVTDSGVIAIRQNDNERWEKH